jgi:hypothetical protein
MREKKIHIVRVRIFIWTESLRLGSKTSSLPSDPERRIDKVIRKPFPLQLLELVPQSTDLLKRKIVAQEEILSPHQRQSQNPEQLIGSHGEGSAIGRLEDFNMKGDKRKALRLQANNCEASIHPSISRPLFLLRPANVFLVLGLVQCYPAIF